MKQKFVLVLFVLSAALPLRAADLQGYPAQPLIFGSFIMTNGTQRVFNVQTNFQTSRDAWNGQVQLYAIIAPTAANSPTNGYCATNVVMQFDYVVGTNVTTCTNFTWTIGGTGLAGAMAQTIPYLGTNACVAWTNLTSLGGLTGLQLDTIITTGTNSVGPTVTVGFITGK